MILTCQKPQLSYVFFVLSLYKFVDDDDDMIHDDQFNLFSRDTHIRPFSFNVEGGWRLVLSVRCSNHRIDING